ncbi:hypothetical protein [Ekhidna sp.]|uniref:hypothetical protein n=1 Tax=Ekhidna sp. TaxID=2608089 RepID=UPI0032EF203D
MIKATKVLNSLSIIFFMAILLLVYAYLPIMVDLNVEELKDFHKQTFFYYTVGGFVVVNVILKLVTSLGAKYLPKEPQAWLNAIIFVINFNITLIVGFIGVWNNPAHIEPESFAYLNYMGPILIIIWVIGLIFLYFKKK